MEKRLMCRLTTQQPQKSHTVESVGPWLFLYVPEKFAVPGVPMTMEVDTIDGKVKETWYIERAYVKNVD